MHPITKRLTVFALPIALALGGCAINPAHPWTDYGLTLAKTSSPAQTATLPFILRVDAVNAPDWLESRNFYYRLNYADPQEIFAYSEARWLTAPPSMLHTLLTERLVRSGLFKAVIGPSNTAEANYDLRLSLQAFEQDFKTVKSSVAIVRLRASLIDDANGRVTAQKQFTIRVPAGQDAQSGAAALNYAANELANDLEDWIADTLHHAKQ